MKKLIVAYFLVGALWSSWVVMGYQATTSEASNYTLPYGVANFARVVAWPIAGPYDIWWAYFGPGSAVEQ